MSGKSSRIFMLCWAIASVAVAGWGLGHAIFSPAVVGPLFFICLALSCLFLAFGSHYFQRWLILGEREHQRPTSEGSSDTR